MKHLLTINTSTETVRDATGEWRPPVQTYGDDLTLALRFEQAINAQTVPLSLDVQSLSAAVGNVDARPQTGRWKLKIGPGASTPVNTTGWLDAGVGPKELQRAINALGDLVTAYGEATVSARGGSYLIVFDAAADEVELAAVSNQLLPIAFGTVRAWTIDGVWTHELRMRTYPVAYTDSSERVLPPPPSITRIQAGGSEGEIMWNEIQRLTLPPDFRGTYQLRWDYKRTGLLSPEDGPEQIAEALNTIVRGGFSVTNPESYQAHIEFVGDLAGENWPLIEVEVVTAPEGDLTFTLALDRPELAALLRENERVELPLVVRAMVKDHDNVYRPKTLMWVPLTIRRGLHFDELASVPEHDWLRPPSPRSYIQRDPSQVITGQQHYVTVIGDHETTVFVVDHNLETDDLSGIVVVNNITGDVLTPGEDYQVEIRSEHTVEITFPIAPEVNAIKLVLTSAGPTSAFIDGILVHIDQVIGLSEILDNLGGRITVLEGVLPSTGPGVTSGSTDSQLVIELPDISRVLFAGEQTIDSASVLLPRQAPYMLPAIHAAPENIPALTDPLPAPAAGTIWVNNGESPIALTIGGRVREDGLKHMVAPDSIAGSDGRTIYPVTRDGETHSYYPSAFDRELWMYYISDKMLRVGRTLDCQFAIALQSIAATSRASWVLEIATGTAPQDLEPNPTGLNLQNIVWDATPMIRRRLIITPLLTKHSFGFRIRRTAGGLALDIAEYGTWEGLNERAPATANFAIRARLIQFDTENSIPTARGYVYYAISGNNDAPAQAIIS